ncbi:hypothetical protein Trydic_g9987 [Trypoxylus dichotomus]
MQQKWIWEMLKAIWKKQKLTKDWENHLIIPICKKEEQTRCENYKAICLAQTSFKLYTRMLEKRLRVCMEQKLEEEQAASKPERQMNDRKFEEGEKMFLVSSI